MTKLTKEEMAYYRKFHLPGTSNLNSVKLDVIYLHVANSLEHEMKKSELAYNLKKLGHHFITEAERSNKAEGKKIVDLVDITAGEEYEIVNKNESDEEILNYRNKGVNVLIVNPMVCMNCCKEYNFNKSGICKNCKVKE